MKDWKTEKHKKEPQRSIAEISPLHEKGEGQGKTSDLHSEQAVVSMHYPKPISLIQVLEDSARWSEFNFVFDPSIDRPIQILAPRRLHPHQALEILIASLETIGLRMIELEGKIMKVVEESKKKIAV